MGGKPKQKEHVETHVETPAEKLSESQILLPKPSGIIVGADHSAMVPAVVIPPKLKEEGYDMNHGFIDSTGNAALKGVVFYVKTTNEADSRHGKVVHAKSLTHYWNGTVKDFKAAFERA